MSSLLAAALARAQGFLLEPKEASPNAPSEREPDQVAGLEPGQVEIAVLGLSAGCGASTVARGIALSLCVAEARTSHVISVGRRVPRSAPARGSPSGISQWDVPLSLNDEAEVAQYGQMVVRLAGRPAAIVWDVDPGQVERAASAVARVDRILMVADGSGEPSLAELVSDMLAQRFGRVLLVANRVREVERWDRRAIACFPDSRIAAALVARGRRPGGAFWAALSQLRALLEGPE